MNHLMQNETIKKATFARGLSSVLYYPAFAFPFKEEENNTTQNYKTEAGTLLKLTKKRCALQSLAIKQHLSHVLGTEQINSQYLFPHDAIISLSMVEPIFQKALWNNMNSFTKACYTPEEFVMQTMTFGGVSWDSYFHDGKNHDKKEEQDAKRKLLQAVLTLHQHDVTHNDILSRNIVIDAKGCLRLIDWEFAVLHYDDTKLEPLLNNLGPFSFLRFTEVMNRFNTDFHGQVREDWKRVWQIIDNFNGIRWIDIRNTKELDCCIQEMLLSQRDIKRKRCY